MKFFKLYSFIFTLLMTFQAHGADYTSPKMPHNMVLYPTVAMAPAIVLPTVHNSRMIASVPVMESQLVPGPDEEIESETIYSPYELAGYHRAMTEIISYKPGRTPASVDNAKWMEEWKR